MPEAHFTLLKSALVFLGSGVGGVLRYWIGGAIQLWWGPQFPLGTFFVNVSGCLVMGFLAALWAGPVRVREEHVAAILIGLLGGYTTYSSFSREALAQLHQGQWLRAFVYVVGTAVLCLLAAWFGAVLAARLGGGLAS